MAQIPDSSGFGQITIRPTPARAGAAGALAAFAEPVGDAFTALGIEKRQQEEYDQRVLQQRQEKAAAAAATRSLELGRIAQQEQADALAEDIRLGNVKKEDAATEWQRRAGEITSASTEGVTDSNHLKTVKDALDINAAQHMRGVRKAVGTRLMEETRSDLTTLLDASEREALSNRPLALTKAATALAQLGPAAGYGPDDQNRLMTQVRERSAFNVGSALVRGARDDSKALDGVLERLKTDEFSDLPPERLGQLEQQVLGRKAIVENHAATMAARAEAAAARRDRLAESSFTATQKLIDGGAVPDPDYLATVTAQTAGTPFAPALTQLLRSANERASFSQLSPDQQQATILALRSKANTSGSTPELEKRIDTFERLHTEGAEQLKRDPLLWGANRRIIDNLQPIEFGSLDQLVPQLQHRAEQAHLVSARAGVPVSPLLSSEADRATGMLSLLPLEQRTRAVTQLGKSVDTRIGQALAAQMSDKDPSLGLAMFAAVNNTPHNLPALILRGADATKAGRIKADDLARSDKGRIAQQLAQVPWATTKARDAAVNAAQLVYDGMRDERGSASVRDAIDLATGGLTEWNGVKVPLPPGMDEGRFRRTLTRPDSQRLAQQAGGAEVVVGGQAMTVDKLAANLGAVRLIPAGPGVYALESGGQIVMTSKRRPLKLDINALGN